MSDYDTSDAEIRAHLGQRLRREHDPTSTILIEELGLDHGRTRVDIAVLDSSLHGFEIKSSRDTLRRLPNQLSTYSAVFGSLTLVVAPDHLRKLDGMLPSWCGVVVVEKRDGFALDFRVEKRSYRNPNPDPFRVAHLLWKSEAMSLLREYGAEEDPARCTRAQLYEKIARCVSMHDLVSYIRKCFVSREDWRDRVEHTRDGD